MPFIGKQPEVGAYQLIDSITTSATATFALAVNGTAYFPASARNLIVSLNGVTQAPESAYTVSGSNIVFDSALTTSDVIDYILVIGDAVDIGTPSDGTVGTAQMSYPLGNFSSTGIDDNATSTAITIDSNENVGIGGEANSFGSGIATLQLNGNNAGNPTRAGALRFRSQDGTSSKCDIYSDNGYMSLYTGNSTTSSERMRIDSSGNVIIKPSGRLYLESSSGFSPYFVEDSNALSVITNNAERMRIDSSGNLLVGTTSTDVITNKTTGIRLENVGNVNLYSGTRTCINLGRANNGVMLQFWINGANTSGGISTTQGGTPVFYASSDERLKYNIFDHESELANVMSLRPARWNWKKKEQGSGEGFIAQELEKTAWSDLVAEGEDGFKTVAGLGAVETRLIKALQEAVIRIETLEAEVAVFKAGD